MLVVFIIVILVLFAIILKNIKFKKLRYNNVLLVNGEIKSGKTTLAVHLAIKEYKRALMHYKVGKLFGKRSEKPLLYSNIPLSGIDYVPLSTEILERKVRCREKSIFLVSEASLLLTSMDIKDKALNDKITIFVKLFAHYTHGGKMFIETQSVSDLHYGFKRNLNQVLYIHSCIKWVPFFLVFRVRELMYSYDNELNANNSVEGDNIDNMKLLIVSKSVWKRFDCYTYSAFTDQLEVVESTEYKTKKDSLKSHEVVSFKEWECLKEEVKK